MSEIDFTSLEDVVERDATVTSVDMSSYSSGIATQEDKETRERSVYESEDGQQSADDVDPRKLFRTPTIDEVRWYYRNEGFASTVVDKPIDDAYKNGFEVTDDYANSVDDFLDDYLPYKKACEKKARRDGPCGLLFKTRDATEVWQSPEEVQQINGYEILTVDKLTDHVDEEQVEEGTEFDSEQYTVLESGLIVIDDISHVDHEELLGYAYDSGDANGTFIHADRCQHFAWNTNNDGDIDANTFGHLDGDSILLPILNGLKAYVKSIWAIGQTMFRYSAPLYAAETPETWGEDEWENFKGQMNGMNAASDVVLPPGTSLTVEGVEGQLDPESYINALVEQICAGSEMTKSVLLGTQSGTVSGSGTDIKNYFNQIERYRQGRAKQKIREAVEMVHSWNKSIIPTFSLAFEINWNALFKVDQLDRMEGMVRVMTAVTNGINNYVLKLDDARDVLEQQWAALDIDVDLDEMTEEDMDALDRINFGQVGVQDPEEPDGNPRVGQNGGGNAAGNTTDPADPTSQ